MRVGRVSDAVVLYESCVIDVVLCVVCLLSYVKVALCINRDFDVLCHEYIAVFMVCGLYSP